MNSLFNKIVSIFSSSRRGLIDTIVSSLPQIVGLATGFFTTILIAKGLGPEGLGVYGLILTIPNFITNISDLGIGQTALRYAAKTSALHDQESQFAVLRWAFRLRIMLIVLFSIIAIAVIPVISSSIWHRSELTYLFLLSLLISFFNVLSAVPAIYFQSNNKFIINSIIRTGQLLISFSGILIIALTRKWNIQILVFVTVCASFISSVVFILSVPRKALLSSNDFSLWNTLGFFGLLKPPCTTTVSNNRDNIGHFTLYMIVSSVVVSITLQLDMWLMGAYLNNEQLGLYNAAGKFTLPLVVLLGAINTALWPRVSRATTAEQIKKLMKSTLFFSIILFVGSFLYSLFFPIFIPIIFGKRFTNGIIIGQILSFRYCIALLFIPISVIGYSMDMAKNYWWINIIQLFAVLISDLILLPILGAKGAAISLVINESIGSFLSATLIYKKYKQLKSNAY